MKELFKSISDAIAGVSGLRWVDFDLGQLEQEDMPPLSFPAALVGFDAADYINLQGTTQQGELNIRIRLAFRVFERTHSKAAANFREIGLAHLDALAAVHQALQGLEGNNFSGLSRIGFENEKRSDLRVYNLIYTTLYTDQTQSEYTDWATASEDADLDLCTDFETA